MARRDLRRLRHVATAVCIAVLSGPAALAQSRTPGGMPPPPGMSLERSNAMRFPQPIQAGQLIGRDVLQPVESQTVLGQVRSIVRDGEGQVLAVISFGGGMFGIGSRLIAVPLNAMVLLGEDMEVAAFTPAQLRGFPTFTAAATTPVSADAMLSVGLAKPSH